MSVKIIALMALLPIIFAASPMHLCQNQWSGRPLPSAIFFGGRQDPCLREPCHVYQSIGTETTIIDFTPNRQITGLRAELWARVIGLVIQHPLPDSMVTNAWQYLTGPQPIPANTPVSFNLTVPVPSGKN